MKILTLRYDEDEPEADTGEVSKEEETEDEEV